MHIKVVVIDGIVVLQIAVPTNVVIRDIVLSVQITNTVKLENLDQVLLNPLHLVNHNLVQVNQALLVHLLLQSHNLKHQISVKELHYV